MAKSKKNRKSITGKKQTTKRTRSASNSPTANRTYKDTVFRMLFSDRENLLSLYNAINGTAYEDSGALEIVTLENAIYMGMKNDLAFIIDTNLFLYEHQSTYNPNMPLRDLFYISSEYQKLVDQDSLYSSTLQRIPAPYFIVFYNGNRKTEDRWENALSEAYEHLTGEPRLELKVVTLNINEGHNKELMEQCQTLREYAKYVAKVRRYTKEMELDAAVKCAVDECIREGILADFLRKNRAEVIAMSIFEYDKEEEEEKKLRRAEFRAGEDSTTRKFVQRMLKADVPIDQIALYTDRTVKEIERIINDFLRENQTKVPAMSIFEYDKEEEEKKLRKAEFKAGYENGFDAGGVNKTKEIIQLMLNAGAPVDKIALYTGCTVDEVKNTIKDFQ